MPLDPAIMPERAQCQLARKVPKVKQAGRHGRVVYLRGPITRHHVNRRDSAFGFGYLFIKGVEGFRRA